MTGDDASLRAYYAARAVEYDRVYEKPERQADLAALRRWLPPRVAGKRLLEVACGTGYWTQLVAPVASGIVAIDAAAETLVIARARVHAETVRFLIADAYRVPASEGPFGAALAAFWFSHVPRHRQREFLAGLATVLSLGARVILIDNLFVAGSSTPISERDQDGNTYQLRRLDDGSSHRVLKNFPTEADLTAAMSGLGDHARFTRFAYFWAFEYRTVAS